MFPAVAKPVSAEPRLSDSLLIISMSADSPIRLTWKEAVACVKARR
jgi:hypothetical protein